MPQKKDEAAKENCSFKSLKALKKGLAAEITKCLGNFGLSQRRAAKKVGISQPDLSAVTNGKSQGFSVERLFKFLSVFGKQIIIKVRDKPSKSAPDVMLGS